MAAILDVGGDFVGEFGLEDLWAVPGGGVTVVGGQTLGNVDFGF